MNILGWIILITTISGVGGTGLGGLIGAVLRRDSKKQSAFFWLSPEES